MEQAPEKPVRKRPREREPVPERTHDQIQQYESQLEQALVGVMHQEKSDE